MPEGAHPGCPQGCPPSLFPLRVERRPRRTVGEQSRWWRAFSLFFSFPSPSSLQRCSPLRWSTFSVQPLPPHSRPLRPAPRSTVSPPDLYASPNHQPSFALVASPHTVHTLPSSWSPVWILRRDRPRSLEPHLPTHVYINRACARPRSVIPRRRPTAVLP